VRVFIGVELDEQVRVRAAAIAGALRARAGRDLDARWIAAANLHITLWFLGEIAEPSLESSLRELGRPVRTAAFDLAVAGLGAFPESGAPRVIWMGVDAGAKQLVELHADLAPRVTSLGIEPERRAYAPHLTVARVKAVRPQHLSHVRAALRETPSDAGTSRITAVTVFRSRLSREGPSYDALIRVPLQ
jgi:2'-5' RNA ligase